MGDEGLEQLQQSSGKPVVTTDRDAEYDARCAELGAIDADLLYVGRGGGTLSIKDGGFVNVAGTVNFGTKSTLEIEPLDTASGPFLIANSLDFNGTLEIFVAEGFLPNLGDSFDVFEFNTGSRGDFARINLPAMGDDRF